MTRMHSLPAKSRVVWIMFCVIGLMIWILSVCMRNYEGSESDIVSMQQLTHTPEI